jgi:2-(1,2-epoxy-1,2-dihydrophenyl)acetyl-CoA isomerase
MTDVITGREGGVVSLTLNRPHARNALTLEMIRSLDSAFASGEHDASVRAYVISGAGEHFMAGGDVKEFYANRNNPPEQRRVETERLHDLVQQLICRMRRAPQPIIASVRGGVAGFGMSLMMACDLAIAADDAFFTLAYRHIGLSPDGSSTWTLPRIVGTRKAMELALLGDRIHAADALRLGLVNKLVSTDLLAQETTALALRLATGPKLALAHTKRLINASLTNTIETQMNLEGVAVSDCMASEDLQEGITAFVEKRAPHFKGR